MREKRDSEAIDRLGLFLSDLDMAQIYHTAVPPSSTVQAGPKAADGLGITKLVIFRWTSRKEGLLSRKGAGAPRYFRHEISLGLISLSHMLVNSSLQPGRRVCLARFV